jgi:hypothetical protein
MIRRKEQEPPPRKPAPVPIGWKFSDWAMI